MSWSQSTITAVNPPVRQGAMWLVSWTTTSPAAWWQIYVDQQLAWVGRATRRCRSPSDVRRIDIGAVNAGDEYTSFAGSLPTSPAHRTTITWTGGTFLAGDLAAYQVCGSQAPEGAIDYAEPLATITAYPSGIYHGSASAPMAAGGGARRGG